MTATVTAAPFRPLDLDAVHAFVLVATLRSFTRAAEASGTTQSAISLKLKRLEDRLGQRLLERTPRQVRLSSQGAAFLEPARRLLAAHDQALAGLEEAPHRLVIGISDHVAGRDLPGLLARLQGRDPTLVMEVRIAASRDLGGLLERGELDAAILRLEPPLDGRLAEPPPETGEPLFIDPLCWFAAPGWEPPPGAPLPIATLSAPCGVRGHATRALDVAGVPWMEVFVGGGVAAVGAAVLAGLGVAALAPRAAPLGSVEVGARFGLPPLPSAPVVLRSAVSDRRSRAALATLVAAFRAAG
ncbi:LysR family transcriptional regulator [Nitrospirillum sp. BR 11163]|uniref:LysR family transcriptional regulator n=1 Tax=Nitrospirillum sp. BR 11163 TaxID=3104323 RepID=UPI002AFDDE82|nr:LysR substrate-binding domain-containing protein [Nitrospirillum sp. BR 11163]MEA1673909.1 LysR substrate-binding domain-containing protein [Nitrospirillum sp. BR 11163]